MVITGGYLRHPKTGSVENEIPTRPFEFDKSQSLVTELAGLGGQVSKMFFEQNLDVYSCILF